MSWQWTKMSARSDLQNTEIHPTLFFDIYAKIACLEGCLYIPYHTIKLQTSKMYKKRTMHCLYIVCTAYLQYRRNLGDPDIYKYMYTVTHTPLISHPLFSHSHSLHITLYNAGNVHFDKYNKICLKQSTCTSFYEFYIQLFMCFCPIWILVAGKCSNW